MNITLGTDPETPLLTLNLGEPHIGYFENGDLTQTAGNLYIYADGKEYGSLFFMTKDDGRLEITLGQYDTETEDWLPVNPLDRPVA